MSNRIISSVLLAATAVSLAACVTEEPGEASIVMPDVMVRGEQNTVTVAWTTNVTSGGCPGVSETDWAPPCENPSSTITVLSTACTGCTIQDDPTGTSFEGQFDATVVATTDGPITFSTTVRFDATGDTKTLTMDSMGDHELGLVALCKLIDTDVLAGYQGSSFGPDASTFVDCGTTRLASQTLVIFPYIPTLRGDIRFPFCPADALCQGNGYQDGRLLSQLTFSTPPDHWEIGGDPSDPQANGVSLPPIGAETFAVMSHLDGVHELVLTAPLATGGISSVTVAIPSL